VNARRAALAAALLAFALPRFSGSAAAADARLRVLIVVDATDDPFAERIKAEVSGLGLEVVAIEPWRTGETVESLDAAGRANQAAAAIRMIPSRKGVEVWMANQPTGRSLLRQLIVDERAGAPNEGLVALQTAELLRTTLLSRSETPPKPPPPPPPPAPEIKTPPSPPSGSVDLAGGPLFSPGGGDVVMHGWLTLGWRFAGPLGIALDLSGPMYANTITGPEGSAKLNAYLGGVSLFVRQEQPGSRFFVVGAAGAAVIRVNAEGTANAPLVASSGSSTAGAIYARADAGFVATRWLRLGGRLVAGAVPQGVPVRFAGNEAALWGRPFLAALVVFDFGW
jgi:hypothetical protein